MKRIHNEIHWSEQHKALLAHCGKQVLRSFAFRGLTEIQELMHEAWLSCLRNRRPDQLHGCGTTVCWRMYEAAMALVTGRSKFIRRAHPATISSMKDNEGRAINPPAPPDSEGPALIDTRDELDHVLARLSPRQRDVLVWRFAEGLTYEEISARLGFTREGARQAVLSALAAARAETSEE